MCSSRFEASETPTLQVLHVLQIAGDIAQVQKALQMIGAKLR